MQTLEREKGLNEAKRGMKDKVREGPKDLHAALRYIFQKPLEWIPPDGSDSDQTNNFMEERYV
jgi:hypothetical protein